jgi:hypothetical protein
VASEQGNFFIPLPNALEFEVFETVSKVPRATLHREPDEADVGKLRPHEPPV